MARRELAVAENVPGDLFVDESCIECDTCRELAPGLRVIHVPGHTRGSCVLLVDDKYLFTGDHLWAWEGRLEMGRNVSWYSWTGQKKSLRKLLDYRFEWVLPGHGRSLHLPADRMRQEMAELDGRLR
jgi:glyoxylase-like metal-dependent hydrolase (beta-lactamase superfamily II)